jgi:hypothetical protein
MPSLTAVQRRPATPDDRFGSIVTPEMGVPVADDAPARGSVQQDSLAKRKINYHRANPTRCLKINETKQPANCLIDHEAPRSEDARCLKINNTGHLVLGRNATAAQPVELISGRMSSQRLGSRPRARPVHLTDLLRNRERLLAAIDADEWAKTEAMPSDEEITKVRRLITRVRHDLEELSPEEKTQIQDAVAVVRRSRTVVLGMPQIRQPLPDLRSERPA